MTLRGRLGGIAASSGGLVAAVAVTAACLPGAGDGPDPGWAETRIEIGPRPAAVLARDFDRDDVLDLAVAHGADGGTVTLLRGDGDGGFAPWQTVPAGANPVELVAGDFDEDGRVDLVVANHETSRLTLLFGAEGGGLVRSGRSRVSLDVAPHVHTAVAGDVNEDGHLDLLVDHRDAGAVRVLTGRGDGTFADAGPVPVGGDPYRWMSLTDRDGDGHLDLATPNPRSVQLLRGDGSGSFEPAEAFDVPELDPFVVVEADVNGDGRLDLGAGGGQGVGAFELWLRDAAGGYGRAPGSPYRIATGPSRATTGDLDGDGLADVLVTSYVGSEVALLLGGDGPVRVVRIPVAGNPYAADIGDFDGDGRADFVTSNDGSGDVSVFLATGGDRER